MEILERVKQDKVKYILLQFSDINGMVKNITIPVSELKQSLEKGTWFDGSSIDGFMRIHESDMYLKPDPETYAVIPWIEDSVKTARFICDIYTPDGKLYDCDPRHILKKVLKEAKELGYTYQVGPEPEFFLLKSDNGIKPLSHDIGGYFDLNMDKAYEIRAQMVEALEKMNIKVEASHHEVAYGQHEIDFRYDDALKTADNVITFKFTLKAIAEKHGLIATFMPKPFFGINGSGMHCHQSFVKEGKNAFYDEKDPYLLSDVAKQFIAGQLKHIKEMSCVLSPLVNSYKRLVPGYEAPVYICWSKTNRSALIRIPRFNPENSEAARAELRCPDPSCNPYLAFAAMLKAGLKGIKENMKTPLPIEEDVYEFDDEKLEKHYIDTLPASLGEAISLMKESKLLLEVFGQSLFWKFIESRKTEWDDYRRRVFDWEIEKYMVKY
ncbi:MAG: type I glutamate--ammonia ligase [archaeon]